MRIMDKLKKKYRNNKLIINFLILTVLIGVIFGTILVVILNDNDKLMVKDCILQYVNSLQSKINFLDLFKNSFFSNFLYVILIWIFGISIIGIPVGIFICFFKRFILGFSISSFVLTYSFKGLIIGFISVLPSVLNLIIIILISIYALKFSYVLVNILLKKVTINFKNIIKIYSFVLLISICYIFITSILETFLPVILKSLAENNGMPVFPKREYKYIDLMGDNDNGEV